MPPSTLLGWLSYIESQHPSNIELGLDRCSLVLSKLKFSRPHDKIITVAGTNGKGSTCAFLTQYFVKAQRTVGTFTSPHFLDFNERIVINNVPVSDVVICEAFEHIESVRGDVALTYFEFSTLAAIWIFSEAKLDYWVLEVGLGGRLDSVNMIDCDIAVITSISLDHTDWLGNSLDVIASEKAAIARKGKLLISGVKQPPETLAQTVLNIGGLVKQKEQDFDFAINEDGKTWSWWGNDMSFDLLPMPQLPIENAATAIAVLSYMQVSLTPIDVFKLMSEASLIGRFQTIQNVPHVIIDIAHNPEAAVELSKQITKLNKPAIALCGMLHDKDIESVIANLKTSFSDWYLVDLEVPRGAKASDIATYVTNPKLYNDVESGLEAAMIQANIEDKVLVVFGSCVTVGNCLTYFKEKRI